MFITVPNEKRLITQATATGAIVDCWTAGDSDAPPDVEGRLFAFYADFLKRTLLADRSWGDSLESVYTAQEIRALFHGKVAGDVVELTKTQYEKLLAVLKRPAVPYNALVIGQILEYAHAIERASTKDPRIAA